MFGSRGRKGQGDGQQEQSTCMGFDRDFVTKMGFRPQLIPLASLAHDPAGPGFHVDESIGAGLDFVPSSFGPGLDGGKEVLNDTGLDDSKQQPLSRHPAFGHR